MVARPWIRVYPQEPNDAIQLVEPVLDQEICQEGMLSPLHISTLQAIIKLLYVNIYLC